jgi:hypothetical protein
MQADESGKVGLELIQHQGIDGCLNLYYFSILCGFKDIVGISHTIHLVWSQEPGQHCTCSGGF